MNMFSSTPKHLPGVPWDVQNIYNMLDPKPKELIINAGSRRLIRQGEIGVYNHKERATKRRFMFLFNDVLLITKKEGAKSFWLKVYINLGSRHSTLRIEDVPDSATRHKVEFRIYTTRRTFIMFTHSFEEKNCWIRDIREAASTTKSSSELGYHSYDGNAQSSHSSSNYSSSTREPEKPAEPAFKITGDIGTIEIPGFAPTVEPSAEEKQSSTFGEFDAFDDSADSTGGFSNPPVNKPVNDLLGLATPATPPSTPTDPSGFDDFDMLANRQSASNPSISSLSNQVDFFAQPGAFSSFENTSPQTSFGATSSQGSFGSAQPAFSNSQPLGQPQQGFPSGGFTQQPPMGGGFQSQPLGGFPSQPLGNSGFSQQPFGSSQPLGNPSVLQPTVSTSILQPTPANTTPSMNSQTFQQNAPPPSGANLSGFSALKALNQAPPSGSSYNQMPPSMMFSQNSFSSSSYSQQQHQQHHYPYGN